MDIIEDVISQGIWDWLEFNSASDSLYFEFFNLKLSSNLILEPSSYDGELTIRFGEGAYLAVYYNDKDDLGFLNLDDEALEKVFNENIQLSEIYPYFFRDLAQKVGDFKFQDYDFLKSLDFQFENKKVLLGKPYINNEFEVINPQKVKENGNELPKALVDKVKEYFSQVLNIEPEEISVDSHFFYDLDGTSLDYMSMLAELQKEFAECISVLNQPAKAATHDSPSLVTNLAIAAIIAAAATYAVCFMIALMDTVIKTEDDIKNMQKLLDMLDDNDDVQNVYHNWEEE